MKIDLRILMGLAAVSGSTAFAQGPGEDRPSAITRGADVEDLVTRMMAFDKDHDGELTRSEIFDKRLERLFDRADADKNGQVTKEELTALATKEHSDQPDFFGGPGGGPGGPPPGFMMGGMPRPGEILPQMLRRDLNLSPDQVSKLDALQKEVDRSLDEILTDSQKKQLKDLRSRGPRGFGPPGGGRRGPGGPPGGPR
jgi:EF hand